MVDTRDLYAEALRALEESPESAETLYRVASEAGDRNAQFQLALVLRRKSSLEATKLFEELDSEDFDGASCCLGQLYWLSDPSTAKYWFRKAAQRKDYMSPVAALNLGMMLSAGTVSEAEEAEDWLWLALNEGEKRAAFWLGVVLEKEAPSRALERYLLAIESGQTEAYHRAGSLLLDRNDLGAARRVYEDGINAGDTRSMLGLSATYRWSRPLLSIRLLCRFLRSGGFLEFRRGQKMRRSLIAS